MLTILARGLVQGWALTTLMLFWSPLSFAQPQQGLPKPGLKSLSPNRWVVVSERFIPHGDWAISENPDCSSDAKSALAQLGDAVLKSIVKNQDIENAVVPLVDQLAQEVDGFLRLQDGIIAHVLSPKRYASCAPIAVVLPKGSTITAIHLWAGDGDRGDAECTADPATQQTTCFPVGYCGWENVPSPGKISNQVVGAIFKNWSNDRARWASMQVEFTVPPGITPVDGDPQTGIIDGSFKASLGGDPALANRCDPYGLTISPLPLTATVGAPLTVNFKVGNMSGGSCNLFSGGTVDWDDGHAQQLPFVLVGRKDACAAPGSPRLSLPKNPYSVSHVYQTAGVYRLVASAYGDFKDIPGSWRCREQRQVSVTVIPTQQSKKTGKKK